MGALTIEAVDLDGLKPTYVAAAVGLADTMQNDGHTVLHVKNGGASPCVVTINSLANCSQGADHDEGGTVPAGEDWFFGPFPRSRFSDPSNDVGIAYDQVSSVTVAALKVN